MHIHYKALEVIRISLIRHLQRYAFNWLKEDSSKPEEEYGIRLQRVRGVSPAYDATPTTEDQYLMTRLFDHAHHPTYGVELPFLIYYHTSSLLC
ncbi:hypothetical protein JTE90_019060 [Oedothorax gibbosus]|uniref:Uncharacterized protein n=1 Tax=Oedothorax gibbosus TaxID=931172 RepID=A0AAV6UXU5_9ARAC|nr:hypothetical protein JTE90_019060 [Oedothorax gibbosus]